MLPRWSGGATIGKTYLYVFILNKISPEPASQFQSNFVQNHPWVKGIPNCRNRGPDGLQRGDNHKNLWGHWIFSPLKNHRARRAHIYMKSFWHSADLRLHKLWFPGSRGLGCTCIYWKECFKMKHLANFNQTWYKPFLHEGNSSLFKMKVPSPLKRGIITKVQK
jgi:hypothetical protein